MKKEKEENNIDKSKKKIRILLTKMINIINIVCSIYLNYK